jgi:uncharacterized protein (UPF0179 family)
MDNSVVFRCFNTISKSIGLNTVNPMNERNVSAVDKLLQWYNHQFANSPINERWLVMFTLYQFACVDSSQLISSGKINIFPVIYGSRAHNRFEKRNHWEYRVHEFCKDRNLDINNIVAIVRQLRVQTSSFSHELSQKISFTKQPETQLYNCIEFTTLWNPNHSTCQSCQYAETCIQILKHDYEMLAKTRFNEL